jgi:3-deoxy-7-phosphoheptulonate synthase
LIFVLRPGSTPHDRAQLIAAIEQRGARAVDVSEGATIAIAAVGSGTQLSGLQALPFVDRALALARPYRQVGREARRADTVVRIGSVPIGGEHFAAIAGPCAVESESQLRAIATAAREAGCAILRGGAYKPRTSPYSFQGLGEEGLDILRAVADELELAVVTEALDTRHVEAVARRADAIQIGSRNSQNFPLLTEAGKVGKPILLKRGMAQTLKELLLAAEYALHAGAPGVILCERGVRTFDSETRHLLDIGAVPALQAMSHLPVIVDPSHATGRSELVAPVAKAAVAAGANGLLIEVHNDPTIALSDGRQALRPAELAALMETVERLLEIEGKVLSAPARRA